MAKFAEFAETAPPQIPLDEQCSDDTLWTSEKTINIWLKTAVPHKLTYAHNAKHNERHQFEENPWLVVFDKEEYGVLIAEWIDRAQNEGGDQGTEEGPPQRFKREIVRNFF